MSKTTLQMPRKTSTTSTTGNSPITITKMLLSLTENQSCADCGDVNPEWASINLGLLLCLKCAGCHRTLGQSISTVRSIQLDVDCWDRRLLDFMYDCLAQNTRLIYEELVPPWYVRPSQFPESSIVRENWVRAKYQRLDFVNSEQGRDIPKFDTKESKTVLTSRRVSIVSIKPPQLTDVTWKPAVKPELHGSPSVKVMAFHGDDDSDDQFCTNLINNNLINDMKIQQEQQELQELQELQEQNDPNPPTPNNHSKPSTTEHDEFISKEHSIEEVHDNTHSTSDLPSNDHLSSLPDIPSLHEEKYNNIPSRKSRSSSIQDHGDVNSGNHRSQSVSRPESISISISMVRKPAPPPPQLFQRNPLNLTINPSLTSSSSTVAFTNNHPAAETVRITTKLFPPTPSSQQSTRTNNMLIAPAATILEDDGDQSTTLQKSRSGYHLPTPSNTHRKSQPFITLVPPDPFLPDPPNGPMLMPEPTFSELLWSSVVKKKKEHSPNNSSNGGVGKWKKRPFIFHRHFLYLYKDSHHTHPKISLNICNAKITLPSSNTGTEFDERYVITVKNDHHEFAFAVSSQTAVLNIAQKITRAQLYFSKTLTHEQVNDFHPSEVLAASPRWCHVQGSLRYEGVLSRQSGLLKTWGEKKIAATSRALYVFNNKDKYKDDDAPERVIPLTNCYITESLDGNGVIRGNHTSRHTFVLVTPTRSHFLSPPNEGAKVVWMETLFQLIEELNKQELFDFVDLEVTK